METLDKVLIWAKSIIINWRINSVGLIGFTAGLIVIKNMNLIIGVAVVAFMITVCIIDKNYNK